MSQNSKNGKKWIILKATPVILLIAVLASIPIFINSSSEKKRIILSLSSHRPEKSTLSSSWRRRLSLLDDLIDVEIPVTNNFDIFYSTPLQVGTPIDGTDPEIFEILLDTGSSDFWVLSEGVVAGQNTVIGAGNTMYHIENSQTGQDLAQDFPVSYGLGMIEGTLTKDSIFIDGLEVENQGFLRATQVSDLDLIDSGTQDGIWGMAFIGIAQDHEPTLLDSMFSQGRISEKMFSFSLTGNNDEGSKLILGPPDDDLSPLGFTTVSVDNLGGFLFWEVPMQHVSVVDGDDSTNVCSIGATFACRGILDSGTTNVFVPPEVFDGLAMAIVANRPDAQLIRQQGQIAGIQLRQTTLAGLPIVNFTIGNTDLSLMPSDYCCDPFGNVRFNLGDPNMPWILGDPFLRAVYTVFDASNTRSPKVLFANQSTPHPSSNNTTEIILIVAGVSVGAVLLLVIYLLFKKCAGRSMPPAAQEALMSPRLEEIRRDQPTIATPPPHVGTANL